MKIALYRKYRPKNFEEMLGQDHVTQTLKNAISKKGSSHAYIFTGPRGVGKTSAARLLAAAVNCTESKNGDPCTKCESCISILENRAIDIIEIDAASNRGIDEIRELKEKVRFSPNKLRFKVFIIDEVHMLTKEAFNALLKTLEEPPAYALFILATTEIHKVPQTILSRCQRFDFKRIAINDLVRQLENIAKKENITITREALALIAESSEGGFRDAISSLDQVSSYKKDIDEKDIITLLGMADYKNLVNFVGYLKEKDAKEAISLVNSLAESGVEITQFTKNIIEFLRKILLVSVIGEEHVEIADEHLKVIKSLTESLSPSEITNYIEIILDNSSKFKGAPLAQLPLEISVVEICLSSGAISTAPSVICPDDSFGRVPTKEESPEKVYKTKDVNKAIKESFHKAETKEENTPDLKNKENIKKQEVVYDKIPRGTDPLEDEAEHWHDFMLEIRGKNAACHNILKLCEFAFDGDILRLTFPFKFHKDRIEDRKNKKDIEEALNRVYNKSYNLVIDVKEDLKGQIEKKQEERKKELTVKAVDIFQGELVE